jgi:hypothetical protein
LTLELAAERETRSLQLAAEAAAAAAREERAARAIQDMSTKLLTCAAENDELMNEMSMYDKIVAQST